MAKDKRWRYLMRSAWFFAAYLFSGIFSDAFWNFAVAQAVQWWHHGGPFKLVFGLVCTTAFLWWQQREAFNRLQSTSQIVPER